MRRLLVRLALTCALMFGVSAPPALAMGLFGEHGGRREHAANTDDHATPEIDPSAAQSAVALVVAGLLILADRRRR